MKNLQEFKVQELEQRLEMADWEASASGSTDGTVTVGVKVKF